MNIAFIGLGIMGSRMAANLLDDHQVTVWNRTKSKADELVSKGATWAESPKAAAANAELIITMVADPNAVDKVAFGENGFVASAKKGTIWIDCSTVNPKFTKETAAKAKSQGLRFLEAPVSGSRPHAQNRELTFLVGGDGDDFESVKPVLELMGKKIVHMGEIGDATSMKLIINSYAATVLAGFAETINAGVKLGLEKDKIIDVIIGSPLAPPYLGFKAARMREGDYDTDFPLRLMHKDLQMMNESAYDVTARMPVSSAVREAFKDAIVKGLGDLDMSAILKNFEE